MEAGPVPVNPGSWSGGSQVSGQSRLPGETPSLETNKQTNKKQGKEKIIMENFKHK
jgi:hypothetical protein